MIQIKDSDARTIAKKRTIKFTGVYIEDGKLVDENGSIAEQLEPELPKWIDTIDFKITFDLPDDDMDIDAPDEGEFDNTETPDGYEGLAF